MFSNSTNHRQQQVQARKFMYCIAPNTNKPMSSVVSNATICSVQILLGDATSIV